MLALILLVSHGVQAGGVAQATVTAPGISHGCPLHPQFILQVRTAQGEVPSDHYFLAGYGTDGAVSIRPTDVSSSDDIELLPTQVETTFQLHGSDVRVTLIGIGATGARAGRSLATNCLAGVTAGVASTLKARLARSVAGR
ncbi:MAG TPA: hypothetical protein VL588_06200 [Bdellovibrionota bacterium]|nr:hypothetical protein [Bdellovibrionota bacterium]